MPVAASSVSWGLLFPPALPLLFQRNATVDTSLFPLRAQGCGGQTGNLGKREN